MEVVGMENVITSLTTSVSATNLWTEVGHAVPLIAIRSSFSDLAIIL